MLDSSGYGPAAFREAGALAPSSRFQLRDGGVPRRPGGPPHLGRCRCNYLSQAHTQLRGISKVSGAPHGGLVLCRNLYH